MKKMRFTIMASFLLFSLFAGQSARADDYLSESADASAQADGLFTTDELDDLLAPIALYPDPLIAQILPAATFVDQIDEAARYVKQYGQSAPVDDQPWDVSVKAIAHYPSVLFMMDQKYDWTVSLGQAYVNQPQDVLDAIQRLRAEANAEGNLVSTPQQEVIIEDQDIQIVPAEPDVIYVPSYDPLLVYVEPPPSYGYVSFGIGFSIGVWLNRDCDWRRHRVYYHGWRGRGWIGRARPYIGPRRSVYINNSYSVINVNRRVLQNDTVRYRADIRRNVEIRQERRAAPATPRAVTPRAAPVPGTTAPRVAPRPGSTDIYRGREPRGAQPAANTGYGGYGSGRDANRYHERGQDSRENMRQFIRRQPAPGSGARPGPSGGRQFAPSTPAPRQSAPVGRGGARGR